MPALHPDIVAHLGDRTYTTCAVVEVLTSTPRRWTDYRGRAASGLRGIDYAGNFYRTYGFSLPDMTENEGVAPIETSITLLNASNEVTELVSDASNLRKPITITQLWILDAALSPDAPPEIVRAVPWFDGELGQPEFEGDQVTIRCYASLGRRGASPKTDSASILVAHALTKGQGIVVRSR